jgi:hypothetical protein
VEEYGWLSVRCEVATYRYELRTFYICLDQGDGMPFLAMVIGEVSLLTGLEACTNNTLRYNRARRGC